MEKYRIIIHLNKKIYTQEIFYGIKSKATKKALELKEKVNPYVFGKPNTSSVTYKIKKEK